jgi:catalase
MTNDDPWQQTDSAKRYGLPALLTRASLARLSVVAAAMLVIVACFAWAGGWLSTGRLDQTRLIDMFEAVNGPHLG